MRRNTSEHTRQDILGDMSEAETAPPGESHRPPAFTDPVGYLARFGIVAQVVEDEATADLRPAA